MKKIILLLNLIAFTAISQVTPVGGYLPLNSSKSFTAGNSTFSNVIARGTFSVGSTATITGAFKGNSTIDGASYKMNGTAIVEAVSSRVLLSGGSYTAVEISGSEPLIMNSAVLTGGNTGTVAVLSDALFVVNFGTGTGSPSDGATYYMGNVSYGFAATNSVIGTVRLPYNCTLVGWDYNTVVNGVIGSGESATIAISGTTNYTLSTAITFSNASIYNNFSGSGLSQSFNAGDVINQKIICPTWATNPTNVMAGLTLWFVRRS